MVEQKSGSVPTLPGQQNHLSKVIIIPTNLYNVFHVSLGDSNSDVNRHVLSGCRTVCLTVNIQTLFISTCSAGSFLGTSRVQQLLHCCAAARTSLESVIGEASSIFRQRSFTD